MAQETQPRTAGRPDTAGTQAEFPPPELAALEDKGELEASGIVTAPAPVHAPPVAPQLPLLPLQQEPVAPPLPRPVVVPAFAPRPQVAPAPTPLRRPVTELVTPPLAILTVLQTLAFATFLLVEPTPRWVALLAAGVAVLGTDGVLRSARREAFESGLDTSAFLFVPALFALATPVFLEYNVRGFWALPAAVAAGPAFGLVVGAEIASVRAAERWRTHARFVIAAATYFVAFAMYSLTYTFELGLGPAVMAVGLIGVLLAVELLREGEIDPLETLAFAAIAGVVTAEARWVLHYLPLDGYLAGLALLLGFYFVTGIVHAYITRHLDTLVALEYSLLTTAGVALVAGARAAGIA